MCKLCDEEGVAEIVYTNYKGETSNRLIIPKKIWFGETEWHPERQWLLTALDLDKKLETRDFAMKDIKEWKISDDKD